MGAHRGAYFPKVGAHSKTSPPGERLRRWGHRARPKGAHRASLGACSGQALTGPAPGVEIPPPSITCGRKKMGNRSVSGVVAQRFDHPPTHRHQSATGPACNSAPGKGLSNVGTGNRAVPAGQPAATARAPGQPVSRPPAKPPGPAIWGHISGLFCVAMAKTKKSNGNNGNNGNTA